VEVVSRASTTRDFERRYNPVTEVLEVTERMSPWA